MAIKLEAVKLIRYLPSAQYIYLVLIQIASALVFVKVAYDSIGQYDL